MFTMTVIFMDSLCGSSDEIYGDPGASMCCRVLYHISCSQATVVKSRWGPRLISEDVEC